MGLSELDEYLGRDFSMNYWADDAIDHAIELVQKMTNSDWNSIGSYWRHRPKTWQYRLAEILSEADPRHAVPLLIDMIQMPDDELAQEGANSLNALYSEDMAPRVDPKIVERLKSLARKRPTFDANVINELLKRIKT